MRSALVYTDNGMRKSKYLGIFREREEGEEEDEGRVMGCRGASAFLRQLEELEEEEDDEWLCCAYVFRSASMLVPHSVAEIWPWTACARYFSSICLTVSGAVPRLGRFACAISFAPEKG